MHSKRLEDRESLGYAGGTSVATGGPRRKYENGGFDYIPQSQQTDYESKVADTSRQWRRKDYEYQPQSQPYNPPYSMSGFKGAYKEHEEYIPQSLQRAGGTRQYASAGYRNPYTFSQPTNWGGIPGGADATPDPYAAKASRRGYERFGPGAHAYRANRNYSGSINQYDTGYIPERIQDWMYMYDKKGNMITRGGGRRRYRVGGTRRFPHGGTHVGGYEGIAGALNTQQDLRNIENVDDPYRNKIGNVEGLSKEQQIQLGLDTTGMFLPPAAWGSSLIDAKNAMKSWGQGDFWKGMGYAGYSALGAVPWAGQWLKNAMKVGKYGKLLKPELIQAGVSGLKGLKTAKTPLKGGKHAYTYNQNIDELGPRYAFDPTSGNSPGVSHDYPSLDPKAYQADVPFWKKSEDTTTDYPALDVSAYKMDMPFWQKLENVKKDTGE